MNRPRIPLALAAVIAAAAVVVAGVGAALVLMSEPSDAPSTGIPATATPMPTPTPSPTATVTPTQVATPVPTAPPMPSPTATPAPVPTPAPARLLPSPTFEAPPGIYTAIALSAGHACALTEAREAVCWDVRSAEVWEAPAGSFTYIAATGPRMCGIRTDGDVVCWAMWGTPIPESAAYPAKDAPPGRYTAVTVAGGYACGLTEAGDAVCWGFYSARERARLASEGHDDASSTEARLRVGWMPGPPPGPFVAITVGHSGYLDGPALSACAARSSGEIVCWDSSGWYTPDVLKEPRQAGNVAVGTALLGDFCLIAAFGGPECPESSDSYTTISGGDGGACGIRADGKAECWRSRIESYRDGVLWVMNPPDPSPGHYVAISTDGGYGCAVTDAGEATCWGSLPNITLRPDPQPAHYLAISDGTNHTCALTEHGQAICWGWNNRGQTNAPPGRYTAISSGEFHTCALTQAGGIDCWGEIHAPPFGMRYTAIATGSDEYGGNACALTAAGDAVCWPGWWPEQERALGPYVSIRTYPWRICALTDDGDLVCGLEHGGPEAAPGGPYQAIDLSPGRVCALTTAGEAECMDPWEYDRIDDGPPAGHYTAIAVGYQHACALTEEGDAACWAWPERRYRDSELERNPYEEQLTQPPPGPFTAISSSQFRSCALTREGEAVCWGDIHYDWPPRPYQLE